MSRTLARTALIVRIVVALVLLQTLYFKDTGAAESVFIFTKIGMEPVGRIGSGIAEGIAAAMLLSRAEAFIVLGAGMALMVILGAILAHFTVLGIEVEGDGGLLFVLALVVFFGSIFTLVVHRAGLAMWWSRFAAARSAE